MLQTLAASAMKTLAASIITADAASRFAAAASRARDSTSIAATPSSRCSAAPINSCSSANFRGISAPRRPLPSGTFLAHWPRRGSCSAARLPAPPQTTGRPKISSASFIAAGIRASCPPIARFINIWMISMRLISLVPSKIMISQIAVRATHRVIFVESIPPQRSPPSSTTNPTCTCRRPSRSSFQSHIIPQHLHRALSNFLSARSRGCRHRWLNLPGAAVHHRLHCEKLDGRLRQLFLHQAEVAIVFQKAFSSLVSSIATSRTYFDPPIADARVSKRPAFRTLNATMCPRPISWSTFFLGTLQFSRKIRAA